MLDTTPPTFNGVPSDVTAEATSASGATVSYTPPTATDAVDGSVSVSCDPASGSTFALGETTVTCTATDKAGSSASAGFKVTVKDTTAPTISGVPSDITQTATSASGANVSYTAPTATDAVDGSVSVSCDPASGNTFALGETTVTCTATDKAGNSASAGFKVKVLYDFEGFFQPVDNLPTLNTAKAGSAIAIPVKFSLGGNMGLDIFEASYPKSQNITCDSTATTDAIEQTARARSSSLSYNASTDQYNYVWKTDKAWRAPAASSP